MEIETIQNKISNSTNKLFSNQLIDFKLTQKALDAPSLNSLTYTNSNQNVQFTCKELSNIKLTNLHLPITKKDFLMNQISEQFVSLKLVEEDVSEKKNNHGKFDNQQLKQFSSKSNNKEFMNINNMILKKRKQIIKVNNIEFEKNSLNKSKQQKTTSKAIAHLIFNKIGRKKYLKNLNLSNNFTPQNEKNQLVITSSRSKQKCQRNSFNLCEDKVNEQKKNRKKSKTQRRKRIVTMFNISNSQKKLNKNCSMGNRSLKNKIRFVNKQNSSFFENSQNNVYKPIKISLNRQKQNVFGLNNTLCVIHRKNSDRNNFISQQNEVKKMMGHKYPQKTAKKSKKTEQKVKQFPIFDKKAVILSKKLVCKAKFSKNT